MLAGVKGNKPELYISDVTGNYFSYFANAIGEKDEKIKEKLREKYKSGLDLKKNIKLAIDIFKEIQGKDFDIDRFELVYIENDKAKLKRLVKEDLKEYTK